ncbi:heparinase II/III family protein [Labilibaculum sp. K2S]|uniref:heparinase II/III domain-containing protein n=1 Tax=Labilibaculum sp. K2S TaxID=3056386 RepID=UPI0025A36D4A|nr:heparinase II/III family protein [Labilibaculum sp. K2S]MDM8159329.1 heparinase II/III family protein [Labilibaculum sp. K2S]
MRKIFLFALICFITHSLFAQKHSYLLHTDVNIARLKEQIKTDVEVKEAWEKQLQKAEDLLKRDRNGAPDLQILGLVYRMTGDTRFAKRLKQTLLWETERTTWEGRELLQRSPAWKGGLETAHACFFISVGFDCAYEYLSQAERKQIAKGIVRLGIKPAMDDWLNSDTNIHTFDTMGHNWWSGCVDMAGFAALAVRNEIPEAKKWAEEISEYSVEWFNYAGNVLQNKPVSFGRNGGFYESINYANFGFSQYLLFRLAHQNVLPKIKMPNIPQMEPMADFFIQTTYYSSEEPMVVNFGDGNSHRNGNACVLLLWNLGFQKDRYAWYLKQTNHGDDKEALTIDTATGLILNPDLADLKKDYVPELPITQLYPDMGWGMLRDSWKSDASFLAVKSGFTWNHSHADAGSYILFHKGKNLIIDSGHSGYSSPLYTQYDCQSAAHNVVLFNGEGQRTKDAYFGVVNSGSLHNLIGTDDFKYLLANATGPYSHILSRNFRSFIWVGDVILVVDDLLADEPGQFEWLLHYNGESKRHGLDLSVKDGNAEVLVRPLFPETFPNGGLPHDFPELMRLQEKLGYKDRNTQQAYWSISHFEKTERTKFISAITLKDEENKDNLPVIERFQGNNFLGVRITQKGKITEVYFNLLADGRLKHRNSMINMNGWETDAYLTAITFNEGDDKSKVENINDLFVTHGSYVRRDGQVLIHALSKYTALVKDFNGRADVIFQGQPIVSFSLYSPTKKSSLIINRKVCESSYDTQKELIKTIIK